MRQRRIFFFLPKVKGTQQFWCPVPFPHVPPAPHNLTRTFGHTAECTIPSIFKTGKFRSSVAENKCLYDNSIKIFFLSQPLSSPFAKQSVSRMWDVTFIHSTQYEGKITGNMTFIKKEQPNYYRNPNLKQLSLEETEG